MMTRFCAVALLLAAASADESCAADESDLHEPTVQQYFSALHDYVEGESPPTAQQIVRVRDVSPAAFDELVRHGTPFVVEDAGRGLPLVALCTHLGCPCTARRRRSRRISAHLGASRGV